MWAYQAYNSKAPSAQYYADWKADAPPSKPPSKSLFTTFQNRLPHISKKLHKNKACSSAPAPVINVAPTVPKDESVAKKKVQFSDAVSEASIATNASKTSRLSSVASLLGFSSGGSAKSPEIPDPKLEEILQLLRQMRDEQAAGTSKPTTYEQTGATKTTKSSSLAQGQQSTVEPSAQDTDSSSVGLNDILPPVRTPGQSGETASPSKPDNAISSGQPPSKNNESRVPKGSSQPQAFCWPNQDEIEFMNGLARNPPRPAPQPTARQHGGDSTARTSGPLSTRETARLDTSARPGLTENHTVDLPSPGGSTIQSDFGPPTGMTLDSGNDFHIVFPSTPTHQPGTPIPKVQTNARRKDELKLPKGYFDGELPSTQSRNNLSDLSTHNTKENDSNTTVSEVLKSRISKTMDGITGERYGREHHQPWLTVDFPSVTLKDMLKDLGALSGGHDTSCGSQVLNWMGEWFKTQPDAFKRANILFSHATRESQLDLIECLAPMRSFLSSPKVSHSMWDQSLINDWYRVCLDVKAGGVFICLPF